MKETLDAPEERAPGIIGTPILLRVGSDLGLEERFHL